jgi:hypothetical protein
MGISEFAIIIEEKPVQLLVYQPGKVASRVSRRAVCWWDALPSFLAGLPTLESTRLLHIPFLFHQGSL